ncbi:MAG: hypothetical protein AB1730_09975 [Myxococcota bacterium]|jgi:hypothetical protein
MDGLIVERTPTGRFARVSKWMRAWQLEGANETTPGPRLDGVREVVEVTRKRVA